MYSRVLLTGPVIPSLSIGLFGSSRVVGGNGQIMAAHRGSLRRLGL